MRTLLTTSRIIPTKKSLLLPVGLSILGIVLMILGFVLVAGVSGTSRAVRDGTFDWETILAGHVDFAGEVVPTDTAHPTLRERLTREFAITRYTVYQFALYHERAPTYFPYIERKLKEYGIPDDFKYLAIAESGLRNSAISDKNAGGIWQFIPDTARRFGLVINDTNDERYDIRQSTDAAMKYFAYLHDRFHDWTLVAAAYNRGEAGITKALTDQHVTSYYDLFLNEETGRYVFRIIAIKYLMEHRTEIFSPFELGDPFPVADTRTVAVHGPLVLSDWAVQNKYSYGTIRDLNPQILTDKLPTGGSWNITVPGK